METIVKQPDPSTREKIERIENLDLEPIMVKLMDEQEGKGWSMEQCFAAEKWYKRFLTLNLLHPGKNIVPNKQIDSFWHFHILDTMKYQEDCNYVFGHFLHHFPYLGLRGKEDAENLSTSFAETLDLFGMEFGEGLSELEDIFYSAATCTGINCGNSNGKANCDTGPGSCHLNCYSSCHATPVAVEMDDILIKKFKRSADFIRPRLVSKF